VDYHQAKPPLRIAADPSPHAGPSAVRTLLISSHPLAGPTGWPSSESIAPTFVQYKAQNKEIATGRQLADSMDCRRR